MIKTLLPLLLACLYLNCVAQKNGIDTTSADYKGMRAKDSTAYVAHIVDSITKRIYIESIKPVGYVNDFENVLDSATIKSLTGKIIQHEKKTTNQIAIVTIAEFGPYTGDIAAFSNNLFNFWGVGQKDKNNGVLIVFSKKLRQVQITTGKGIEDALTDAMCKRIIDAYMIPDFKKNNYTAGITKGLTEIIRILEKK